MRNAGLFLSFHDEVDEMMCVSRSVMNSQTSPMKEHFTSICTSLRYLSIYTSLNSVSNRDDVSERILVLSSEDRFVRYAHQAWGQRFLNSQLSPTLISYWTDAEAMNLSGGSSLFSHFRKTEAFPTDSFNTLGQSPRGSIYCNDLDFLYTLFIWYAYFRCVWLWWASEHWEQLQWFCTCGFRVQVDDGQKICAEFLFNMGPDFRWRAQYCCAPFSKILGLGSWLH